MPTVYPTTRNEKKIFPHLEGIGLVYKVTTLTPWEGTKGQRKDADLQIESAS